MRKEHLATDLETQSNKYMIKFHYIYNNFKPNSRDYDERGLGLYNFKGQWYAIIQRTYF